MRFGIGRLAAILGIGAGVAAVLVAMSMGFGQPKALLYANLLVPNKPSDVVPGSHIICKY